ncbi:TIGR00730 family Rossman fold protein [Lutibacter sp.]|uniref:LOG family protein n=1 Tax=Lutibacter sp. TaxID=1925666 RepID=UPI0025C4AD94|nr:TIGR00730 family Rossman fold protein [Lutibacter sp.]MCF6182383.1 TIGR00730 family Rossman fold protein [Lutibacter sp.]
MKKIAVFCGSSLGFSEVYKNDAIKLGTYFADNKISLVYGGGKIGMMGALADSILKKNGEVIGVIPGLLRHEEVAHSNISEMIVTKTMSDRKVTISKLVDGYIALPGGFGTLDEIFEALTLSQLGIEQKPVGILNTNGFFNHLIKQLAVMVAEGYLKESNKNMLITADSVEELITKMNTYKAPKITKVINKIVS